MFSDQTILIINVTCIVFLAAMMGLLIAGTRMRGGAGWAAIIMVTSTVPAYLSNTIRTLGTDAFLTSFYFAVTFNLLCFPALWFFVRSQYDKSFRIKWKHLYHLLPAVISLTVAIVYYGPMSPEQVAADVEYLEAGNESLPTAVNNVLLYGLFFVYFGAIFFYIRRRKKFLRDNYSDSDYFTLRWVPKFLIAFFALFFIVVVGILIDPRSDAWLIPILNSAAMGYLVYIIIFHSTQPYLNRLAVANSGQAIEQENGKVAPAMDAGQMREVCDKVVEYLKSSGAYINPDYSLSMLSVDTGVSSRTLSRSINGYLNKKFFDLINEMRVEDAKKKLLGLNDNLIIDSVAEECGFRSRTTFFSAFKKTTGTTPTQWMKSQK